MGDIDSLPVLICIVGAHSLGDSVNANPAHHGYTAMNDYAINAERQASALLITRDALLEIWHGRDPSLDPMDAILLATVIQANVEPATTNLDDQVHHSSLLQPPPTEVRRPVSISRLADSMELRFETVRRRVNRLKALGLFVTEPSGIMVPESYFLTPENAAMVKVIDDLAERTYWRLVNIHYFNSAPLPGPAHCPDQHPYRAVARLFMSYALRMAGEMRAIGGDYINLLLIMQLHQMNTVNLGDARKWDPAEDEGLPTVADHRRLPATIAALSRESGVPFETTRRRLADLAERGVCQQVEGGYIMPAGMIQSLGVALSPVNRMNLTRLYRTCALVGAIDGWESRMEVRTAS